MLYYKQCFAFATIQSIASHQKVLSGSQSGVWAFSDFFVGVAYQAYIGIRLDSRIFNVINTILFLPVRCSNQFVALLLAETWFIAEANFGPIGLFVSLDWNFRILTQS
jgi:hypothetical protein